MKYLYGIVLFTIATMFVVSAEENSAATARITEMVGSVEVRSGASAAWRTARIGMPLKAAGDVRTFLESEAEITLTTGTKLKIGESSVVSLATVLLDKQVETTKSTVKVMTGTVWANVKKITDTRSEFDFETPTAVASIRGTRLGIDVGKLRTRIDVYEGSVVVRKKNSNATVKVMAHTRAIVEKGKSTIALLDFKNVVTEGGETEEKGDVPFDPYAPTEDSVSTPAGTGKTPLDSSNASNSMAPAATDTNGSAAYQQSNDTAAARQPLILLVNNLENGMEVSSKSIQIDISVSEGASFSVNGRVGVRDVVLKEGANTITVDAWDRYNHRQSQQFTVVLTAVRGFTLGIIAPASGARITEPLIQVTGSTLPDAKVFVNDMQVAVGRDGFFSGRVPFPMSPTPTP